MFQTIKAWLFRRTATKRTIFFLTFDVLFITLACYLGFFVRFDGAIAANYYSVLPKYILLTLPVLISLFGMEKLYAISWSFVSIRELLRLARATLIGYLIIGTILFFLRDFDSFVGFPRSVIFISGFLTLLFIGTLRFAKRIYLHGFRQGIVNDRGKKKILIFGAGEAGESLLRYLMNHNKHWPIGFLDDNPMKQGVMIHGIKVLGSRQDLAVIHSKQPIDELLIAAPSASRPTIREIVKLAREAGIQNIKTLPGTGEIIDEHFDLRHLRDIKIEDLLGRETIKINTSEIENFICDKTVLVTGGAGSIGSHLCRQLLKFNPAHLLVIDQNETGLFHLAAELSKQYANIKKTFVVGNICDKAKIGTLLAANKPNVIFHAAAYKHVPMMESHPDEAVRNNIFGTLTLAQAAIKQNVEKFIFISTDKAINPTSVMGASKRVGELIAMWLNQQNATKFSAVRFGNVLDSQGNVVGIFENQIKRGGPVEITHPEMKRYFMVTSEACLLVMQAGALGRGGEVFVFDMGEPIKIIDLAKEMIRLAGLEPDIDIPIIFTGIRQGEKLFEEITTVGEAPTRHEKIFISKLNSVDGAALAENLCKLKQTLLVGDNDKVIQMIKTIVPNFKPAGHMDTIIHSAIRQ